MPIHPDVAARLHHLDGIESFREAFADSAQRAQVQRFVSWHPAVPPPHIHWLTKAVPGPNGPVPVRTYSPRTGATIDRPCLVWVHGGGFVGGDLDMEEADWTAREVCARAGAVVVSVDYRLAVEGVSYPVPHDDVVAAVSWVRDNTEELSVDPARLSIGGASAGGNLSTGAVLRLRDRDSWLPASLIVVYSLFHPITPPAGSSLAAALAELPPVLRMQPADSRSLCENYIGGPASAATGYAMPGIAVLSGLCPTLVLNAEYNDLRASGEAFSAQLALAGVDVQQVTIRGMLHAFLNLPAQLEPVGRCLDLIADRTARPQIGKPG